VTADRQSITLRGKAIYPRKPDGPGRDLLMILDRISVAPLDEEPPEARALAPITASPPAKHLDRLRHTENRPPSADPEGFAIHAATQRNDMVTIGTMNGRVQVFFPTDLATVHPQAKPGYLNEVIRQLRQRHMDVLSWVVFNVQDTRDAETYEPAKRYPQWTMKFIEEPGREVRRPRVGMCVVSSPYIEHHGRLLKQAAAFDLDGFFFDGFYLGGIPHPSQPGCTCQFCREKFHADTGLELPTVVDWTNPTFRRWVRWRNHRLLAVARYFRDQMRQANPDATFTFNWNIWPFASKGWETGIPMWRVDDLGVSQHGYSGSYPMKWMMQGFKSRVGRDMNPAQTDLWRTGSVWSTCGRGREPNWEWHELEMLTFILSGPTYGISTWHGPIAGPVELTARIHTAVAKREPYFSRDHVADVGVLISQNTHDFVGYQPDTENRVDYQDTILGTWSILSDHHVPFEFIFDNQLDPSVTAYPEADDVIDIPDDALARYRTIVLPDAAALSDKAVDRLDAWVRAGGHLITTAGTGSRDVWGQPPLPASSGQPFPASSGRRHASVLQERFGIDPAKLTKVDRDRGTVTHLPDEPGRAWTRDRDRAAADALLEAIRDRPTPLPLEVNGPPSLVANMFINPADPNERWIQLLNVAHLYPGGDAGFRGLRRPPAKDRLPGSGNYGWPMKPASSVRLRLPGMNPQSARLAIAGEELSIDADGWMTVPEVELHDVVVVEIP
jgi:hypothetical protein